MANRNEPVDILICGASGFIGRHLAAALAARGHHVRYGVRNTADVRHGVAIDYLRDHTAEAWLPRLMGVEVVINAVGILRERSGLSFGALHVRAPIALFDACMQAGVRRVVQISALGADDQAQSRYHRSKKQADDHLAALPLDWVVVQPSLVYGPDGTSATLFTTLAALPLIPLPGRGTQPVQPVHIDDLTQAVVRLAEYEQPLRGHLYAVGPAPLPLRDWLATLRAQMRLPRAPFMATPMPLVRAIAAIGNRLPGLLDSESLAMLERGNTAPCDAMIDLLGRPPRSVSQFIEPATARATANTARLNWVLPMLRASIALVWIITGLISLGLYPVEASYALLAQVGISGIPAPLALYGSALLDLSFGIGIYVVQPRQRRRLWRAQAALIIGYSAIIAWFLPEYWLHPFGPLLKNIPMLAVILLLHEFEGAR